MSSPDITIYTPNNRMTASQEDEIVDFLGTHLEQYGDNESDIRKAIAYAMKTFPPRADSYWWIQMENRS
jgi:hypothetical protein